MYNETKSPAPDNSVRAATSCSKSGDQTLLRRREKQLAFHLLTSRLQGDLLASVICDLLIHVIPHLQSHPSHKNYKNIADINGIMDPTFQHLLSTNTIVSWSKSDYKYPGHLGYTTSPCSGGKDASWPRSLVPLQSQAPFLLIFSPNTICQESQNVPKA